jgi:hypothetical protein
MARGVVAPPVMASISWAGEEGAGAAAPAHAEHQREEHGLEDVAQQASQARAALGRTASACWRRAGVSPASPRVKIMTVVLKS